MKKKAYETPSAQLNRYAADIVLVSFGDNDGMNPWNTFGGEEL